MMAAVSAPPRGILRQNASYTNKRVERDRIISPATSSYSDTYPPYGSPDEELHYGPGIVNKLRSRFLSKTVREPERHQPALLRRTASLEDWLEKDSNESVFLAPSPTSTEPIIRSTAIRSDRPISVDSGLKKRDQPAVRPTRPILMNKRSVSTSDLRLSGGRVGPRMIPFKEVVIVEGVKTPTTPIAPVILPPQIPIAVEVPKIRRISTNTRYGVQDNQLPPPDTVRQVKKLFEEKGPQREQSPGRGSREGSPAPTLPPSSTPPPPPQPSKAIDQRKVTPPSSVLLGPRGFTKPAPSGPKPVITAPRFAPGARPIRQTVRSIPTPPRTKEVIIITQADMVDSSQKLSEKAVTPSTLPVEAKKEPSPLPSLPSINPPVKAKSVTFEVAVGSEVAKEEVRSPQPNSVRSQVLALNSSPRAQDVPIESPKFPAKSFSFAHPSEVLVEAAVKHEETVGSTTLKVEMLGRVTSVTQGITTKPSETIVKTPTPVTVSLQNGKETIEDDDESDGAQTKRIAAKALDNIRKEGVSMNFNFKNSASKPQDKKIGVIRPIQKQEPKKLNPAPEKLSPPLEKKNYSPPLEKNNPGNPMEKRGNPANPMEKKGNPGHPIEKKSNPAPTQQKKDPSRQGAVEIKHKFTVTNVVENSEPKKATKKAGGRWHQEEQNTMVFKFVDRKDKPTYVEDSKHTPSKQIYNKKDSGITFISPSAAESSDYVEQDDDNSSSPPPPPCNVIFENDNIIINGRSNIKKKPKPNKLNISFNDDATVLFEYPSEQSILIEEPVTDDIVTVTETRSVSISPVGDSSGGLASYTPSKVQYVETFELGVSRSASLTPTPPPSTQPEEEEDFFRPLEEGAAFSNEATADLLF